MTALADTDLVTAVIKRTDHLKARAEASVAAHDVLVPFSVGIELLFVARKHGLPCVDVVGAASARFPVDRLNVLLTAAEALDEGTLSTVFDAIHASQALHDGVDLVTTDRKLLASPFPTRPF